MKTHVNGTSDQARVPDGRLTPEEAATRVAAQIRESVFALAAMIEAARQMGLEVNFSIQPGPTGNITQCCRVIRAVEV